MAARINPRHCQMIRDKIQASELINRLHDDAMGKITLTVGQRDSIKYLITQSIGAPPQSIAVDYTDRSVDELSDAELYDILKSRDRRGTAETEAGSSDDSAVH